MWIPVLKVVAAIAAALILILIASRKWRPGRRNDRMLRSLPGQMVQEIADRLVQPEELLAYLNAFFGATYHGAEQPVENTAALQQILPVELPAEEFSDLIRTAGAIEPDALLAYACPIPDHTQPAVITVCRGEEGKGLLVGVFQPE